MAFKLHIPKIDLDQILLDKPPTFNCHKYKLYYLLYLIVERMNYTYSMFGTDGYAQLSSTLVKNMIGSDYVQHLEYLVQVEIVKTDRHYIVGEKAIGYRIPEQLLNDFKEVEIINLPLSQKLHQLLNQSVNTGTYEYLHKFFKTGKLSINLKDAIAYCKSKAESGVIELTTPKFKDGKWISAKPKDAAIIWKTQQSNVYDISKSLSWFTVDETAGRLHTRLTNLKSELRQFLHYGGEELVEIDIKNSQPYFSLKLLFNQYELVHGEHLPLEIQRNTRLPNKFEPHIKEITYTESLNETLIKDYLAILSNVKIKNEEKKLDLNKVTDRMDIEELRGIRSETVSTSPTNFNPSISNDSTNKSIPSLSFHYIMFPKTSQISHNQYVTVLEIAAYIKLVMDGQLYDFLKTPFEQATGLNLSSRKELKSLVFEVIYGSPKKPTAAKKVFSKTFPTVAKLFNDIKVDKHNQLPIKLQQIEAEAVLGVICKRISKEKPQLPLFTIHDSILTTKGNEHYVKDVMEQELTSFVGVPPTLSLD